MAGAARAGSPPATGLRLARTRAPLRLRECGRILERPELRPVLVCRVGRRPTRDPGRARPPSGGPARAREGSRRPRAAGRRGLRPRRARHRRDRPAPTRRMTVVDAFLRERGATFAVEGLDAGWSTVLVTPWWHASRHVVALVYSRRDGRMALVLKLPRRPGDEGGIRKEAESLRLLAQVSPSAAERGPRVVALTRFRGISLLAETAVCG